VQTELSSGATGTKAGGLNTGEEASEAAVVGGTRTRPGLHWPASSASLTLH